MQKLGKIRVLFVCLLVLQNCISFGFQSQFFRDERGGFFRLDFSLEEFPGISADPLTIVPDNNNIFGLYRIDTSRIANMESQVPQDQWQFVNGNKEVQKLKRWESSLISESEKFFRRRQALGSILELEDKGEFVLDPIERSNVDSKITDLISKEEPLSERLAKLKADREVLEKKLVNQFSEQRRKIFHEKPDFSVLGRYSNSGEVKVRFNDSRDGKTIKEVVLSLPETFGGNEVLIQQWLKAQMEDLEKLGASTPGDSVFSYFKLQSSRRLLRESQAFDPSELRAKRGNNEKAPDLYSLTTGALAIQESLQLDRMTDSLNKTSIPDISIKRLSGPNTKSHPFLEMLVNKPSKTLPIDDLVPSEFYSCHFSDINQEIDFSDLFEQWGASLLQALQVSAHDAQVKEKFFRQLCLETSELTRLFGARAIDDLTVCGSDPLLHEGTDLTVIFSLKNKGLFDTNVMRYFARAKADFPDCREETISYGDLKIRALTTPDREIRSFSCDLDSDRFKVYSNSRRAIELIIDTFNGKHKSLAQAVDYRYMRTIFPFDRSKEDLFLYLSEDHIRGLLGPVWKIGRQRRLQCVNSMRILQNSATLFRSERATGTPTLERLIQDGFVESSYLFCPDGGTYSLSASYSEPICSQHGKLRFFAPILEQPPTLVTENEMDQYQKFVQEYNSYWSHFFDPIGIRGILNSPGKGETSGRGIDLETCILPLIQNTVYDGFKRFSAGTPAKMDFPTHPETIVQFLFKISLQDLRNWGDPAAERFFKTLTQKTSLSTGELVDALGDALSINFVDNDLKFSINLARAGPILGFLRPMMLSDEFAVLFGNILISSLNVPTYAVISVRDEMKVERFIREWLRSLSMESAMSNKNLSDPLNREIATYETSPAPGGSKIYSLDFHLFIIRLHFFFNVHNGHLIIANQRKIITDIWKHPEIRTTAETNLGVRFLLENFKAVSQTAHLYWQERIRAVCGNNLGSLVALRRFRGFDPADWWKESLKINGYAPFCPASGTYQIDPLRDTINCSVHGDILSPCQPFELDMSVPLNKFVSSLKIIEAGLTFTSEGIMTRVRLGR